MVGNCLKPAGAPFLEGSQWGSVILNIWTISDLHLKIAEARAGALPFDIPEADVCVIAGDVTDGIGASMEWMAKAIRPHMPVVAVLGNHEFFGHDIPAGRRTAAQIASALDIHLLDDTAVEINEVCFVGGTLWTDFRLFEVGVETPRFTQRECMVAAKRALPDFEEIWAEEASNMRMVRYFSPKDAVSLHEGAVSSMERLIVLHEQQPVVVVTHHAPCPRSVSDGFVDNPVSAAYASDMTGFIEAFRPEVWIHGHTHESFAYEVGSTRVICNPRGYESRANLLFDPGLVLEVPSAPRLCRS